MGTAVNAARLRMQHGCECSVGCLCSDGINPLRSRSSDCFKFPWIGCGDGVQDGLQDGLQGWYIAGWAVRSGSLDLARLHQLHRGHLMHHGSLGQGARLKHAVAHAGHR